jgi:hypothetical protein
MSTEPRQRKQFDADGQDAYAQPQPGRRPTSSDSPTGILAQLLRGVASKFNLQGPFTGTQVVVFVALALLLGLFISSIIGGLLSSLFSILGIFTGGRSLYSAGKVGLGWWILQRFLKAYHVPTMWSLRKVGSMFGVPPEACDGVTQCVHALGSRWGVPTDILPQQ